MTQRHMMHVASQIFGTPLAMTETAAIDVLVALRSKLNIGLIETIEGRQIGSEELEHLSNQALDMDAEDRPRRAKLFHQVDNIAHIPVEGVLARKWGLDPYCGMTGLDGIKAKVFAAVNDPTVDGIMLDVDSPGGPVSGLFDCADFIYACSERQGGKPIWAIANEQAASGGMMLFSCGDERFLTRTSHVGSMGVFTMHIDRQEEAKMRGHKVTIIRSGAHKIEGNAYEDLGADTLARIQSDVDLIREIFIETAGRNLATESRSEEAMKKIVRETEGLTYIGAQARDIGLATSVASEDQVWAQFMDRLGR